MKEQFLNLTGLTELVGYLKTSIANHKEILPYASNKLFPSVGDINTIYIDTATNTIYRWDNSSKTYITLAKAVKSVAISEATENGKITLTVDGVKTTVPIHGLKSAAFTESSAYSPAGHTHTKAQIGLGNVDNTADKDKSVKHASTADSATSAGTATTATNVNGENATVDAARHVWFSDSTTETKRNYNDNFKYNPTTNTVTTNISGSAASANSVLWSGVTNKPSTFTPSAHNHDDSTITSLNASKLFGTIDIARLPHGALERLVIVADDTARFKLTTANVQLGDTVKVTKTEKMYYVVDESKLSSEAGYLVYTAGTATSVPWSGVTGKPSSYPPASHNHDERYYTETEMNSKLAEKATKVHTHVKSEVGLGNVDNTADANKSVKYATSAGSAGSASSMSNSGTLDTVAKLDAFIEGGKVKYATVSALDGLNGMIKNDGICISTPWTSTGYGHQFYINDNGYDLYHRYRNTTKVNNVDTPSWSPWKQILDSSNYNTYAPTKTGGGASGTWGISISGNASTASSVAWDNVSGRPSSMPASDVYAWAKASSKPSYSKSEVGLGNVDNTADSAKSVKYAASAGSAGSASNVKDSGDSNAITFSYSKAGLNYGDYTWLAVWNGREMRAVNKNQFATSGHTHNYAGSGSAGGSANSAVKLDTATAGSATQPVYFSGGKPVACSYTINASVPAGAKFTDTNTWRGVQNNLTSTATDQSLSAAQGKVLNEKKMSAVSANGYYGMARPDNNTSDWIRTTTNGLLPVQSGGRGSGHSSLGTSSWYFSQAYVDHVYTTDVKIADKVTLQYDSTNTCLNFVFS